MATPGYEWLIDHYGLQVMQPVGFDTQHADGIADDPMAHLALALEHQGVHLELLARLFTVIDITDLVVWIRRGPNDPQARRAGFLFEWLTGDELPVDGMSGEYQDVLDPERYIVADEAVVDERWRVRNNLPGTRAYCPTIRCTRMIDRASSYDIRGDMDRVISESGIDVEREFRRYNEPIFLAEEIEASFELEREEYRKSEMLVFAGMMSENLRFERALDFNALSDLQAVVMGERENKKGMRESTVYIGSRSLIGLTVRYVAPPASELSGMMDGFFCSVKNTSEQNPAIRAAAASIGIALILPFPDGNGRVSRYLVNDLLVRGCGSRVSVVLPISAHILESRDARVAYYASLAEYSSQMGPHFVRDGRVDPDNPVLMPAWRYPDSTLQVDALVGAMADTVDIYMPRALRVMKR